MTDRITAQELESQTTKARPLMLDLSDKEVGCLFLKAASAGLTVEELLENFIHDLTGEAFSNGSDERMFAGSWFERCQFGLRRRTFLQHLVKTDKLDEVWDKWQDYQSCLSDLDAPDTDLTPEELTECRLDASESAKYLQTIYATYDSSGDWQKGMQEVADWELRLYKMLYCHNS